MATGGWVADLGKKERKNWVLVGCALNIAKNGISPKIQKEMEAWYRNQHQFSPNNIHTLSRDKVRKINEMIT